MSLSLDSKHSGNNPWINHSNEFPVAVRFYYAFAIFTTGGTIDNVNFDAKSTFEVGEAQILEVLREANLRVDSQVTP